MASLFFITASNFSSKLVLALLV